MTRRIRKLFLETLERRDVPSFGLPQAFLAGPSPTDTVSADFNGDGLQDVAVANNSTPGFVNVLLNNGAGGFLAPRNFPAGGARTDSLVVGDVNGDGRLDLVVTNTGSGTVSVLRGSGTGAFRRPIAFGAGGDPHEIALADFNNDGISDLAVTNDAPGTASILLGQPGGAFALSASYPMGTKPSDLTTGDFNADGNADLIVVGSHNNSQHVVVSLGLGNGFLDGGTTYNGSAPGSITSGDFDADGDLDLAVASKTGFALNIWRANGDGTFALPGFADTYTVGNDLKAVESADVDGDGILDLIVSNTDDGTLDVLLGRGNGSFDAAVRYPAGVNPSRAVVRDFTGDGIVDLALANAAPGNGTVTLVKGVGGGAFEGSVTVVDAGLHISSIVATDLNGDGDPDLGVTNEFSSSSLSVLLGQAGSGFSTKTTYNAGLGSSALTAADYDGDGAQDFAIGTSAPGGMSVAFGNGGGGIKVAPNYNTGIRAVMTADFNDDGILDLAGGNQGCCVGIQLGNGDGTFQPPAIYLGGGSVRALAAGDFNGDDLPDLALTNDITGAGTVTVLLNLGGGVFGGPVSYGVGSRPYDVAVGDFDGDGDLDIVNSHLYSSFVSVLLGNGDGTFQPSVPYTTSARPGPISLGDVDGDGDVDVVAGTVNQLEFNVLLGNGDGSFQPPIVAPLPDSTRDVALGDLDGNGDLDLVVAHYENYQSPISVLMGNGDGTFEPPQGYLAGDSAGATVIADFDGDAALDIAVANSDLNQSSNRSLSVLHGNGDGTFEPSVFYLAGTSFFSLTAGDFNSDGTVDLAVGDGLLSVLLNTGTRFEAIGNYGAFLSPSTALVSADFNGDGILDVAESMSQNPGFVSVWIGRPGGVFESQSLDFPVGANPTDIATADFNGDGIPDIVTANSQGITVSILLGIGDGTFQSGGEYAAATAPNAIVAADFDGDGDIDVAVTNDLTTGTINVLENRGDGVFMPPTGYAVGSGPKDIATGDVDGDNIVDLVVVNSSGGTVSLLFGNGDGTFQTALHYAGLTGPIAFALTDVNGDGRLDLAVAQANGVAILVNTPGFPAPLPQGPRPAAPLDVLEEVHTPALSVRLVETEEKATAPSRKRHIARLAVARTVDPAFDLFSTKVH